MSIDVSSEVSGDVSSEVSRDVSGEGHGFYSGFQRLNTQSVFLRRKQAYVSLAFRLCQTE